MATNRIGQRFITDFDRLYAPYQLAAVTEEATGCLQIVVRLDSQRKAVLMCKAASRGTPTQLKQAYEQLRLRCPKDDGNRSLALIAPSIGAAGLRLCRRWGVGCFDLTGQVLLRMGDATIRQQGGRVAVHDQRPRSFEGAANRVLLALLVYSEERFTQTSLAQRLGVSQGWISRVLSGLVEQGWIEVGRGDRVGIRVLAPGALLDACRTDYTPNVLSSSNWVSAMGVEANEVGRRLATYGAKHGLRYALTGFVGAALYGAAGPYVQVMAYLDAEPVELASLAKAMAFAPADSDLRATPMTTAAKTLLTKKPMTTMTQVMLLKPKDEMVLTTVVPIRRRANLIAVAHPVLCYLDLWRAAGRGRDQAEVFRNTVMSY